jgi:alanine racemase
MNSHDRSLIKNENFIEKTNMDAYVEIDLNAIGNNLIEIKKTSKHDIDIMAVVKSNAYGHDIIEVSKYLSDKKNGVCIRRKGDRGSNIA